MNVFLPFTNNKNHYFSEISSRFNGKFLFDKYNLLDTYSDISIINIHWPEAIFNFRKASNKDLELFKKTFQEWKKRGKKIVYTRHNTKPHDVDTPIYSELYKYICNNVDGVIHLGEFSNYQFKDAYPHSKAKSVIIKHPLFLNTSNISSKCESLKFLKLSDSYKYILVFGALRKPQEIKIIREYSNNLNGTGFKLLIANYRIWSPRRHGVMKSIKYAFDNIQSLILNKNIKVLDYFGRYIPEENIQFYMNASDGVLIPRYDVLNSGVLFLAFRFDKFVIGPNVGNISEELSEEPNIIFDPLKDLSITKAARATIEHKSVKSNLQNKLKTHHPQLIAEEYHSFFQYLINSSN